MNGTIAAIVTLGFGTFGSVGLTVTVGYGIGSGATAAVINGPLEYTLPANRFEFTLPPGRKEYTLEKP